MRPLSPPSHQVRRQCGWDLLTWERKEPEVTFPGVLCFQLLYYWRTEIGPKYYLVGPKVSSPLCSWCEIRQAYIYIVTAGTRSGYRSENLSGCVSGKAGECAFPVARQRGHSGERLSVPGAERRESEEPRAAPLRFPAGLCGRRRCRPRRR